MYLFTLTSLKASFVPEFVKLFKRVGLSTFRKLLGSRFDTSFLRAKLASARPYQARIFILDPTKMTFIY